MNQVHPEPDSGLRLIGHLIPRFKVSNLRKDSHPILHFIRVISLLLLSSFNSPLIPTSYIQVRTRQCHLDPWKDGKNPLDARAFGTSRFEEELEFIHNSGKHELLLEEGTLEMILSKKIRMK